MLYILSLYSKCYGVDMSRKIETIIQIVGWFLKLNNGSMNYTKLIKLMYIADKRALKDYNYSISNDDIVSMKNGPVLSNTYDLIKHTGDNAEIQGINEWNKYFVKTGYELSFKENMEDEINNILSDDVLWLSDADIEIIEEVYNQYKDYTYSAMIDLIHNALLFPEVNWKQAEIYSTSIPMDFITLMKSLNKSDDTIREFLHMSGRSITDD